MSEIKFIRIGWVGWVRRGRHYRPGRSSAGHISTDGGKTTLCGITIPQDAFDFQYRNHAVECAKCASKLTKMEKPA